MVKRLKFNRAVGKRLLGRPKSKDQSGFTLLELLVTLAIAAIVTAMAAPGFSALIDSNRLTAAYNGFVGELTFARSEAVKRSTTVAICSSSDAASCNSNGWENGRLVFVDGDADGDLDEGEELIKIFPATPGDLTLRTSALSDAGAVIFQADGTITDAGTLFLCDDRGASYAKGVTLSIIGQPQLAYDTDETPNGTIDDADGGEVSCP
nr:GspH/FimT family pseudopilin [Pseudomaricurvus alkylphenolicus]